MCVCVCVWLKPECSSWTCSSPALMCSSPALMCSSPAQNAFVSISKSVHPQPSPAWNVSFVCSVICIWRWAVETIMSLAMNEYVCSVKLESPQKRKKLGESFWKKSFQVRDGPMKRTETRQGWENSTALPYCGKMVASNAMHLHPSSLCGLLSGLQRNAIASLVHFVLCKVN